MGFVVSFLLLYVCVVSAFYCYSCNAYYIFKKYFFCILSKCEKIHDNKTVYYHVIMDFIC